MTRMPLDDDAMGTHRLTPVALAFLMLAATPLPGDAAEQERAEIEGLAGQAFPDDERMVALAEAIAAGETEAIPRLARGLDLDARGDRGVNLLQWALLHRRAPAMRALLDLGAGATAPGLGGNSAFHLAAALDAPEFLDALLARGTDPASRSAATGDTALHAAVLAGREANARALLSAGADIDAANRGGDTPLHLAGSAGDTGLVLFLLERGASPGARNAAGHTFDDYLFSMSEEFLDQETRGELQRIRDLLRRAGPSGAAD